MTEPLAGGCLCGAVRYTITAAPVLSVNCHCRDCQVLGGAPVHAALGVAAAAIAISGALTEYERRANSGLAVRVAFCPVCGSRLFGYPEASPDLVSVAATSLDDPTAFQPRMAIFAASAPPWHAPDPAIPAFPGMPDSSP